MNIDEARQHRKAPSINFLRSAGKFGGYGADTAIFYCDVGGGGVLRGNDCAAAHYKVSHGASPTV